MENVHCNLNQLQVLTEKALDKIGPTSWDRCVSKVMKEAQLYMVYDGISPQPPNTVALPAPVSPVEGTATAVNPGHSLTASASTVSLVGGSTTSEKNPGQALKVASSSEKAFIVNKCTEELISPVVLSKMYKRSVATIRRWVIESGKILPKKYKICQKGPVSFTSSESLSLTTSSNPQTLRIANELISNLFSKWPSLNATVLKNNPNPSFTQTSSAKTDQSCATSIPFPNPSVKVRPVDSTDVVSLDHSYAAATLSVSQVEGTATTINPGHSLTASSSTVSSVGGHYH